MSSSQTTHNQLLIVGMVLLTFATGYLFLRVHDLESQIAVNDAGNVAGAQAQEGAQPQQPQQPERNLDALPEVTAQDHIRGSLDADIILIEYSDYECPFCKQFHGTMQQVMDEYGDRVAWIYRHYPLDFHPKAQKTAEATECAAELGGNEAFWQMSDLIIENMPEIGLSELPTLAGEIGLDPVAFRTCLDSGKYAQKIKDQMAAGAQAGVSGTPGTIAITKDGTKKYINGAQPFEAVQSTLDTLLK